MTDEGPAAQTEVTWRRPLLPQKGKPTLVPGDHHDSSNPAATATDRMHTECHTVCAEINAGGASLLPARQAEEPGRPRNRSGATGWSRLRVPRKRAQLPNHLLPAFAFSWGLGPCTHLPGVLDTLPQCYRVDGTGANRAGPQTGPETRDWKSHEVSKHVGFSAQRSQ